jgi:hypothetical protein
MWELIQNLMQGSASDSAIQFYSCIGVTTAPGLMTNGPDKNPKNDLMNAWLLTDI